MAENWPQDDENKGKEEECNPEDLYQKAEDYWKGVEPSEDGMLGGFSHLTDIDVRDSKKFIKILMKKKCLGKGLAVDCGSGIGRVSKCLLLPLFDSVDMVDVTTEFMAASAQYLGPRLNSRIGKKFTCGLQNFDPEPERYDLIWVQWVSGHLSDEDLENITKTETPDFDSEDHSYTRPKELLVEIFQRARLHVICERKQTQWPAGMYEVRMFAMRELNPALN